MIFKNKKGDTTVLRIIILAIVIGLAAAVLIWMIVHLIKGDIGDALKGQIKGLTDKLKNAFGSIPGSEGAETTTSGEGESSLPSQGASIDPSTILMWGNQYVIKRGIEYRVQTYRGAYYFIKYTEDTGSCSQIAYRRESESSYSGALCISETTSPAFSGPLAISRVRPVDSQGRITIQIWKTTSSDK